MCKELPLNSGLIRINQNVLEDFLCESTGSPTRSLPIQLKCEFALLNLNERKGTEYSYTTVN